MRFRGSPFVLLLLVAVAVAAVFASSGGGSDDPRLSRPALERLAVGQGARGATVFHMRGAGRRPALVFLHGWGLKGPLAYRPWLEHLARTGSTVIVPRYQASLRSRPDRALANAAAGIRAALRRVPVRRGDVVIVGHSAGAALGADLATGIEPSGLAPARGLLLMYPGRAIKDFPAGIPPQDLSRIPSSTSTVVVASPVDRVVGDGPARELHGTLAANGLDDLQLLEVTDPGLGEHFAPARSRPEVRSYFWRLLDRLVTRTRRPEGR